MVRQCEAFEAYILQIMLAALKNVLNESDNIRSILVSFYTSTKSAVLSVHS